MTATAFPELISSFFHAQWVISSCGPTVEIIRISNSCRFYDVLKCTHIHVHIHTFNILYCASVSSCDYMCVYGNKRVRVRCELENPWKVKDSFVRTCPAVRTHKLALSICNVCHLSTSFELPFATLSLQNVFVRAKVVSNACHLDGLPHTPGVIGGVDGCHSNDAFLLWTWSALLLCYKCICTRMYVCTIYTFTIQYLYTRK